MDRVSVFFSVPLYATDCIKLHRTECWSPWLKEVMGSFPDTVPTVKSHSPLCSPPPRSADCPDLALHKLLEEVRQCSNSCMSFLGISEIFCLVPSGDYSVFKTLLSS